MEELALKCESIELSPYGLSNNLQLSKLCPSLGA